MKNVGTLCLLLFPSLAAAQAVQAPAVRIALVTSETKDAARNVLDLVQAKANLAGVDFLERSALEKLLAEQKLSLAGLVDADKAVRVGRILKADVLAIVEISAGGKDPLGLVVYETASGIRLADQALGGKGLDEHVQAAAAALEAALKRFREPPAQRKTLCLASVRNAELPRSLDNACQSLALLLERRLLQGDGIALLERKRLEALTKEKKLQPEGNKDLLASLVLLDLQLARGKDGAGIRATAFLHDVAGKELHRVEATTEKLSPAALVEPLRQGILKYLEVAAPAAAADLKAESARFFREGHLLWSFKEPVSAIQALEAAAALNPGDYPTQTKLAEYLSEHAYFLLNPRRSTFGGAYRHKCPPEDLKASLALARRALEVRADTLQSKTPLDPKVLGIHRNVFMFVPSTYYINNLAHIPEADFNDDTRQARTDFFHTLQRAILEELDAWAEVCRKDPTALGSYTMRVHDWAKNINYLLKDLDQRCDFWRPVLLRWETATRLPNARHQPWIYNWMLERYTTPHPGLVEVFEKLSDNPYPLLALYGKYGVLQARLGKKEISAEELFERFPKIKDAALKAIQDFKGPPAAEALEDLRTGIYTFLNRALQTMGYARPKNFSHWNQLEEKLALADFMVARHELPHQVFEDIVHVDSFKDKYLERKWGLVQKALEILESPRCQLVAHKPSFKGQLEGVQKSIQKQAPQLVVKTELAPAPWSKATLLLNAADLGAPAILSRPLVIGDEAYVVGSFAVKDKTYVAPIRVPLGKGEPKVLAKAEVKHTAPKADGWGNYHDVTGLCVAKDAIYIATKKDGVFVFDHEGGGGRNLFDGLELPSQETQAIAELEGKLYAALEGGYLVRIDPAKKTYEVLASSRRREKLSPFDNDEIFVIKHLTADPERDRLFMLLYQKPKYIYYHPKTVPAHTTTNGLWDLDLKSGKFTRRIELFWDSMSWMSQVRDGKLFLQGQWGAVDYDLTADRPTLLWCGYPCGPQLLREQAKSRDEYYGMGMPRFARDGWLWTSAAFGRISLQQHQRERFPSPVDGSEKFEPRSGMEPVGKDAALVCSYDRLYLLKMKASPSPTAERKMP